jgi:hypothetical protein
MERIDEHWKPLRYRAGMRLEGLRQLSHLLSRRQIGCSKDELSQTEPRLTPLTLTTSLKPATEVSRWKWTTAIPA